MFESISTVAHIIAAFWCFLLFAPAKWIRWGWLWYAQILATEWGFGTLLLAILLITSDITTTWFAFAVIYYLVSRVHTFSSTSLTFPQTSKWQLIGDLLTQNIWPFQKAPQSQPLQLPNENITHKKFHSSTQGKVCIHIHGGAWIHGDASQLTYTADFLNQFDYETVSINYLKHPRYCLTEIAASVEETFKALCQIYGPDQKFLIYGRSAGAHLSLMLGARFPERIEGVIALYPVTDFPSLEASASDTDILKTKSWIQGLFQNETQNKAPLSPAQIYTAQAPNTFIVHGENDPVVPVQQSDLFFEKMKSAHNAISYLRFNRGTHGFDGFSGGLSMSVFKRALQVFIKSLK